jgi:mono/diheme cytochrome c family protein
MSRNSLGKRVAVSVTALAATLYLSLGLTQATQPALGPLNMDTPALNPAEAKSLKNPIRNTQKSIARGRTLYLTSGCVSCHGNDGKALIEVVANATDLTAPALYKNGTLEGEVFRSIRDGAGVAMPPFKAQIAHEEDIWHLVNFVRNLWPADKKPAAATQ